MNNPHYSKGSQGVSSKARVSCLGTCGCAPTITARVQGALYFSTQTGSSYTKVRSLDEPAAVLKTDGTEYTFYVPKLGEFGYPRNGWYNTTGTLNPSGAAPATNSIFGVQVSNVPF